MVISTVLNRWLNRAYKVLAILLVLVAVAISALRLMLPYAENYRVNLQNYINENYQLNLVIGNLNAGWLDLGPTLIAENVSLLQTDQASIFIDKIDISLDFWASIKAREFITNDFTLTGAKIFVNKTSIEQQLADNKNKPTAKLATIERISKLFLTQIDHFSMRNGQVLVETSPSKRHSIFINQLAWKNIDQQHNAQGDVVFGNLSAKNLKLQLALVGDTPQTIDGKVYVEGNNIDITPWLGKTLKIKAENIDSAINFKSWLVIKAGSAERLQVQLGKNHINWQYQGENHLLTLEQGELNTKFFGNLNKLQLSTSPLNFQLDQQPWQPINFQIARDPRSFTSYISAINLQQIAPLMPILINDQALLTQIKELSPVGSINNIFLQKRRQQYNVAAEFEDISIKYHQGIPGIEHVSGDFLAEGDYFRLAVKAKQGKIDFNKHFISAFPYRYLSAVINGKISQQGWQLSSNNIQFNSDELSLTGELALTQHQDSSPTMALFANVSDVNAINAHHYFPHLLMGKNLVSYLNKGLIKGQVHQAKVLFNGPLARFPFTDHSGIFTVDAELQNASFQFDPHWPTIKKFNANLNFTNNSMLITGRSGDLLGVDVSGVKAEIADLTHNPLLNITAKVNNVAPESVRNLMAHSPLQQTVGKTLAQLTLANNVNGNFSLKVPLNTPEKTIAAGDIFLKNNQLVLKTPAMVFKQVTGKLHFNNDKINVDNLQLNWRGMPLTLAVKASDKKDNYQTDIAMKALWQSKQWQAQLPKSLTAYGDGELAWQGKLSLFMSHQGGFSYQLGLQSNLEKLQLNLPAPYHKKNDDKLTTRIQVNGQDNASTIVANIGDKLSFYGELNHKHTQFSRAHLVLGDEQMLLPMDGFYITANVEKAQFSQWQPLISDILTSINEYKPEQEQQYTPLLTAPERINGSIKEFSLFGQQLSDVSFNLSDKTSWWLLSLNAKEARSQIKLYPDWITQGIDINADFLHLPAITTEEKDKTFSPFDSKRLFASIPPMTVHCANCSYGKFDFGSVDFSIKRDEKNNSIQLKQLMAQHDKNKFMMDGQWKYSKGKSSTTIFGELKVKDIAHEFERLGYASVIKESGGFAKFNLHWQGGPHEFALAKLNGEISSRIDDGVLKINNKGEKLARLTSILSLSSLLRKMTLDFRDIFSNGMFYSYIKGDYHLKDGIIYTDNTRMKGAAGDLVMKGNTNLALGKLDYKATYKPNVTSSVPVIAWIATLNPVGFLAGIALDQVVTAAVPIEMKFEITGDVLNPQVVKVDSKTRNVMVGRSTPPKFVDNIDKTNSASDIHSSQQQRSKSFDNQPLHEKNINNKTPKSEIKEKPIDG